MSVESSGVPVYGRKDMLASVTSQSVRQADYQCAEGLGFILGGKRGRDE